MEINKYLNDKDILLRALRMINEYIYTELSENYTDIKTGDRDKILEKVMDFYYVNKQILELIKK